MNPDLQSKCAANPEQCYFGNAPALAELRSAFGSSFTEKWISIQLDRVLAMLGTKDNVQSSILEAISQDILSNYSWLTASEFMLFCSRVKVGKYGKIAYGQVAVDDITSKLPAFAEEREKEMQRISRRREDEEREREYRERAEKCVTHYEAYRIINAAADGDIEARHRLHDDPHNWEQRIFSIKWADDIDPELKKNIAAYFNIEQNFLTKLPTAHFTDDRYAKFKEGIAKGYYSIAEP